ncbi:MAG: Histone acetyltransferase HPA2 and related acetyltransferases [uncultured Sphingomonadaceae bacterium]|uniref:Histone acetyltransferase HPA2 and related acetyltransferases n=1 Tax=uncultured Sphingomonadaceae bacterium TaxID=169976 RepID=A0A6J4TJA2_9SPHN|nr:MAG: Histone acetyltransferase HPA2 and related acetyltransferases [uncultured Sphingomonadaceae bacterium]
MLFPVPPGEIAAVVTYLEMRERPRPAPLPPSPLRLERWLAPAPERYRTLFRRVGAPWLWFSRLVMDDAALSAIIHDPGVEVYAVTERGIEVGLLELDFRDAGTAALSYVALVPELAGRGHGRWLLAQALMLAWRRGVERATVHTCTLDHPAALPAYRRAGFVAVARTVETFFDPRLSGFLEPTDAPQIPVLGTEASGAARVS